MSNPDYLTFPIGLMLFFPPCGSDSSWSVYSKENPEYFWNGEYYKYNCRKLQSLTIGDIIVDYFSIIAFNYRLIFYCFEFVSDFGLNTSGLGLMQCFGLVNFVHLLFVYFLVSGWFQTEFSGLSRVQPDRTELYSFLHFRNWQPHSFEILILPLKLHKFMGQPFFFFVLFLSKISINIFKSISD